jgi:DNA-binding transcriptional regulator PaaX
MKTNTQKLLTWLYSSVADQPRTIGYQQLELILPDMTAGGRRSLVHYLTKKLLVRTERIGDQVYISLTPHGADALVAQFPVFNEAWQQWQGEWSVLIFRSGPKGDPHFRYLRQLLLDNHAFSLSRGVYLYPGDLPSQIINVCKDMYVGAVVVVTAQQWVFGDERNIINQQYLLLDLIEVYSGISKEINQLLELKNNKKRLTKKARLQVYSVFDRLFNVLSQDPGFLTYYYPQTSSALVMLSQLHSMYE